MFLHNIGAHKHIWMYSLGGGAMVVNDALLMTLVSITKKAFLPPFVALISVHLGIQITDVML